RPTMNSDKPSRLRSLASAALRLVWHSFALFGIGVAIYASCFNVSRITSPSMAPTLQGTSWENGDSVLTEKITYAFRKPRRWEVMTIRKPDSTLIMKRVFGLPGETIQIPTRGKIFIDGKELVVPPALSFLEHRAYGNLTGGQEFKCESGYYVLGDDTVDSDDSRFNGCVLPQEIVGRAWMILAPASRRGLVYSAEKHAGG
ncbi:MAG: signal peptidase I, partial [Planctomycetota bacterium]